MRVVAKGTSVPDNHFKLASTFQILVYFCYFLFGQWEPEKKKQLWLPTSYSLRWSSEFVIQQNIGLIKYFFKKN